MSTDVSGTKIRTPLTFLFIQSGLKNAPDVGGHLSDIGEAQVKNTIDVLKTRLSPSYVDLSADAVRVISAPDTHTQQVAALIATTLQGLDTNADVPVKASESYALQDEGTEEGTEQERLAFYSSVAENTREQYNTVIVVASDIVIDETTRTLTGCQADFVEAVSHKDDDVHARMVRVPDRSQLLVPLHEQDDTDEACDAVKRYANYNDLRVLVI